MPEGAPAMTPEQEQVADLLNFYARGRRGVEQTPPYQDKGQALVDAAKREFPILNTLDMQYKFTPRQDSGYLEFWQADEPGTTEHPRPPEFPMGKPGVEIYDLNTKPIDIMGDIASHLLKDTDPVIKDYYEQFQRSMTPEQIERLKEQYAWAQAHYQESRPFEAWREHSGLPGYFRGYAFQQWDRPKERYTPAQLNMFDDMMQYLREGQREGQ